MSVLNSILGFFAPKDKKFFVLFDKSASNLVEISQQLKSLMTTPPGAGRQDLVRHIHDLENVGDTHTHDLMVELSSNFITPFDREDIHSLASAMDNVADYIDACAKRIELYNIDEITEPMKELADLLTKATAELKIGIMELKNMKNVVRVKEALIRVNSIENQSDMIYNYAIAELFKTEKDAIKLIKYREILEHLENAIDRCEDVGDVIESILVKNS
jgi:uncharacterized protein